MATRSDRGATVPLRTRIIIAIGIVIVFLSATAGAAATFYTDYLWYLDLGQTDVFWTRILSAWAVGATFGVATFAILYVNLVVARRLRPRVSPAAWPQGVALTPQQQIEEALARVRGRSSPSRGGSSSRSRCCWHGASGHRWPAAGRPSASPLRG